jgi:hypothetical protein
MAKENESGDKLKLSFVEAPEGEKAPKLAVYVIDRAGETVHRAEVGANGEVKVPDAALKKGSQVIVGPAAKTAGDVDPGERLVFHTDYIREVISAGAELEIPIDRLIPFRRCVDGTVERCIPFPWLIDTLVARASQSAHVANFEKAEVSQAIKLDAAKLQDSILARPPFRPPFVPRCTRVCEGLVLVYRRVCCCEPWIIEDPRLGDLIDKLKQLANQRPPIKWPPGPDPGPLFGGINPGVTPDPAPIDRLPFFNGGTLDAASLNVEQDVRRLESLSGPEVADYVSEREYLRPYWCSCGAPGLVAEGLIQPDGTFRICWREPIFRLRPGCHEEFAFVVRQVINGLTVTIYDGLAAHQWFDNSSGINLVTYDRRAAVCGDNSFPGEDGAFVVLEHIGAARSYRLKTPAQDTWDGVLPPVYNDGLLDPAASPAAAKGTYLDSNWGGTLALHYHFSEGMKAAGARYYRISATRADASGNPTGSPTVLSSSLGWLYMEAVGPNILVQAETLGPVTKGSENNLFLIPFDADHDWQDDQYHGFLDTTALADDRYLVMVEVFDGAGNKLRPAGSSGPGTDAGFTYRRWSVEIGPLDNVPFAALTHMFWWDNRPSVAHIYDLRLNGVSSSEECQFLVGTPSSTFSTGYRAYAQNPMFLLNYTLWWRRGLGGPSGTLITSSDNAGEPPDPLAVSPTATFATMLGPHNRCSFSLNLHTNVKTQNGSGVLTYLDADDQAAFALEN